MNHSKLTPQDCRAFLEENRGFTRGFIFYPGYYEAVAGLPDENRLHVIDAILLYGSTLTEPENLNPLEMSVFLALKPNILQSIEKSISNFLNGSKPKKKSGLSETQSSLKPEEDTSSSSADASASSSDDASASDEEEASDGSVTFSAFWDAYPKKVRYDEAEAAFKALSPDERSLLLPAIERQKGSKQWTESGGQYIPTPSNWLSRRRWMDELPSASPPSPALSLRPPVRDDAKTLRQLAQLQKKMKADTG